MKESRHFEASLSQLEMIMDWVRAHLSKYVTEEKRAKQIELAMEEAAVNVISYAYPKDIGSLEVQVIFDKDQKLLSFFLLDSGIPFDPLKAPCSDITSQIEDREPGGLGIFLIRKVTDEVSYTRLDGKNILSLVNRV